ncbi:MAG: anti-sigma factor antagonist [Chloroflexus sp.]|uniref:STAS domain-containing protein n=1 Tax=Chloroflexus sp. TaxID=1904827 RepID=UPI0021DCC113|nr:STAS domain-containing protein [Chloroflexus sp.]GIV91064.1 MAG: anti-sigma factor antagonist [Chloroflexus sp.]
MLEEFMKGALMEITVNPMNERAVVVQLRGRLDLLVATEVKQRLSQIVSDGFRLIVVDMGEVSFVDSSGLGALIGGLKAARLAGGDLRLVNLNAQAQAILELTTLNRVLRPYPNVDEALHAV